MRDEIGFTQNEVEEIRLKNRTIYKNHNTKNPFRESKNELFQTKVSFKSLNLKFSRNSIFQNKKRLLQEEREKKFFAQTSKQFCISKPNAIMSKLFQLHDKLEKSLEYNNQTTDCNIQKNNKVNKYLIIDKRDMYSRSGKESPNRIEE